MNFTAPLRNADHVFFTNYEDIGKVFEELDSLKTNKPVYLAAEVDHKTLNGALVPVYDPLNDKYTFYVNGSDDSLSYDEFLKKCFSTLNYNKGAQTIGKTKLFSFKLYCLQNSLNF